MHPKIKVFNDIHNMVFAKISVLLDSVLLHVHQDLWLKIDLTCFFWKTANDLECHFLLRFVVSDYINVAETPVANLTDDFVSKPF